MPELDPTDIPPRRNLPKEAEPWGRFIDTRQAGIVTQLHALKQSVAGQGRNSAAVLANISEQLNEISDQQTEILETQTRLSETNEIVRQTHTLNTNTSGWLPALDVTPPSWANYAMVTASFSKGTSSTTRQIILPVYARILDSPSLGIKTGMVANGFFTGDWWSPNEATTPIVVDTNQTGGVLTLQAYRNIMASGSGSITVDIFYSITWSD